MKKTIESRFWSKVIITNHCWLWTGALSKGYGALRINKNKKTPAHRFAYEFFKGKITDGLVLDHICRTRHCVNPNHLEPVTNRENILRGIGLAAKQVKRTHCPSGHEYNDENTYNYRGMRYCKKCRNNGGRNKWTQ